MEEAMGRLSSVTAAWKLCRRTNGAYEIEAMFYFDNGWSRCGECNTVLLAFEAAIRTAPRIGENPHLSDADRQMIIQAEQATPPLPA